ncbi:MAG: glycoside hydrolase family 32 protein [Kiritimatiellales bacterium]|nr:glycoside hydrolase family 32 protein [Kiritimatiellales bacterium]
MAYKMTMAILGMGVMLFSPGIEAADFDFSAGLPPGWIAKGDAFGSGDKAVKQISDLSLYYAKAEPAAGIIVSAEFTITTPYLNIQVDGGTLKGRLSLIRVLDGNRQVIRKSLASNLQINGWLKGGWFTFDVRDYLGEKAYFQLSDCRSLSQVNLKQILFGNEPRGDFSGKVYIEATQQVLDRDKATADADPFRPVLHAQAASGKTWDANGLVCKDGLYHFFYLIAPNGAPPVQGHKVSTDLVAWEERPIAAWPSVEAGEEGVWSGSAAIGDDGRCHIFYSGIGPDRSSIFSHRQGHLVSTDSSFDQFEKVNASMITMDDIPVPAQSVRDPFVFRDGKTWYLTLTGSVLKDGNEALADQKIKWPDSAIQGAVFLFRSENLYDWKFEGIACKSENKPLWEVSDFIKRKDGLWLFSPGGKEYHIGRFDLDNATFEPVRPQEKISIGEFYAYHSITVPDRRHLVMGRLTDGGGTAKKWVGTYAFPREWSFDGNTLIQKPARELQGLRKEHFSHAGTVLSGVQPIDKVDTEYELLVEMDLGTASKCGLEIRRSDDGTRGYRITWDGQKAYCQSIAPEPPEITAWWINPLPIVPENKSGSKQVKFHLFVDRGLVELFVDDQKTFERPVEHIPLGDTGIAVFAAGGDAQVVSFDRWNLGRKNEK